MLSLRTNSISKRAAKLLPSHGLSKGVEGDDVESFVTATAQVSEYVRTSTCLLFATMKEYLKSLFPACQQLLTDNARKLRAPTSVS